MTDRSAYRWYIEALAGRKGRISDGFPQCGFYKKRSIPFNHPGGRTAPWDRCAIWINPDGVIVGAVNGDPVDANDLWLWCAKNPIHEKEYRHHEEYGEWPAVEKETA